MPSLDEAQLPFHTRLVLPHTHSYLDPSPRIIECSNKEKKGTRNQWKENCKSQCKMGDSTCLAEFHLFCLKEVLTSAFIASWNSPSSLFKICLHFSNSSAMISPFSLFLCFGMQCEQVKFSKQNGTTLIRNSGWLPHDSHETKVVPLSHWLTFLV